MTPAEGGDQDGRDEKKGMQRKADAARTRQPFCPASAGMVYSAMQFVS
jgi:hypothetical protein